MLNIAICDDENVIINQIEGLLLEIERRSSIELEMDVFYSGEALQKSVLSGKRYDLIYLDIQMEGENGIDTAKSLRIIDKDFLLVYVSGYDKYLMELFQLDVLQFIKKPIKPRLFKEVFWEAYQKICSRKVYYVFQYKNQEYKIPTNDILYFESRGRQIRIQIREGQDFFYNGKLNETENKMKRGKIPFLRIHQSYLVNYHWIQIRSKNKVRLLDGTELPISEERQRNFQREYGKLLGGEICVSNS